MRNRPECFVDVLAVVVLVENKKDRSSHLASNVTARK